MRILLSNLLTFTIIYISILCTRIYFGEHFLKLAHKTFAQHFLHLNVKLVFNVFESLTAENYLLCVFTPNLEIKRKMVDL